MPCTLAAPTMGLHMVAWSGQATAHGGPSQRAARPPVAKDRPGAGGHSPKGGRKGAPAMDSQSRVRPAFGALQALTAIGRAPRYSSVSSRSRRPGRATDRAYRHESGWARSGPSRTGTADGCPRMRAALPDQAPAARLGGPTIRRLAACATATGSGTGGDAGGASRQAGAASVESNASQRFREIMRSSTGATGTR